MIPKAMDSLDVVEAVTLIEEIFGTDIPDRDAEGLGSPPEMVDWLERHLSNRRPNKEAAAFPQACCCGLDSNDHATVVVEQILVVVAQPCPASARCCHGARPIYGTLSMGVRARVSAVVHR